MSQHQQAEQLFKDSKKTIIVFKPAISIKKTPHSFPTYLEDITEIKGSIVITVRTSANKMRKPLEKLTDEEVNSLVIRLTALKQGN